MFNSTLSRSMPRPTAWSTSAWYCGVKLDHAIHVFDSRSVLTQFGVHQGPVDQGVNVITLQDDGLPVVFNGFPKLSNVSVDHSQVVPARDGSRVKGDCFFEVGQRSLQVVLGVEAASWLVYRVGESDARCRAFQ